MKNQKTGQSPVFVTLKLDMEQTFQLIGALNVNKHLEVQELERMQASMASNPEENYGNRIARLTAYINIGDSILEQIHAQHKWLGNKEEEAQ